jgi:hypothetical protein
MNAEAQPWLRFKHIDNGFFQAHCFSHIDWGCREWFQSNIDHATHIRGGTMVSKYLSRILIITLSFVLCTPAKAQHFGKIVSNGTIAGVIVGVVAGVVVIAILAVHYSKMRTITGCVNPGGSGMTVIDEKDKRIYTLSRMRLEGKKAKSTAPQPLEWEAKRVAKDFGVCRP